MPRTMIAIAIAVAAALGLISGAQAGQFPEFEDKCGSAPFGPTVKLDPTIPDAKMAELRKDVLDFMTASDQFQDCINRIVTQGPTFKKTDNTPEARSAIIDRFAREAAKILEESQTEKERVGIDFNKLVDLRKKAAAK